MSETQTETKAPAETEALVATTETQAPAVAIAPAEEPKNEPAKTGWEQRRIDELTRKFRDEERKTAALELELARLRPGGQSPEQKTAADLQLEIQSRAQALAAQALWDQQCNDIFNAGKKEFADFPQQIEKFGKLGGLPQAVIEAAMEAGDAHKVLAGLAGDLDEASRIFALSPVRQAAAVAKFANKLGAEPKPGSSNAPPPVGPKVTTSGKPAVALDDEKVSMADWMAMREKELATKRRR